MLVRSLHVHAASLPLSPMTFDVRAAAGVRAPSFEQAFRDLYASRFASLYRYLDRMTGDAELAADVAQEAFIRLHGRGEMPDEPVGWLVTVATNLVRDDRRLTGRRLRLLSEQPQRVPLGAPADPDADLERGERIGAVRAALETLTPRDRQALLLKHSGYSYREIAAALGLAETSIGTTLVRAGQAFRAAFQELHGAPE
jgi:RNA polymerase sigma-70 factor (ECF subfamily)